MTTTLEGGKKSASRPGHSLPPGKARYPLYRRLCGPQGRSGQVRKISPPLGFDPQTVQPVASRYTDYVTWPTHKEHSPSQLQKYFFFWFYCLPHREQHSTKSGGHSRWQVTNIRWTSCKVSDFFVRLEQKAGYFDIFR